MNGPITIVIDQAAITVEIPKTPPITIVIDQPAITITGNLTMPTFVPFTFTCTIQGQTQFGPLPLTPLAIWLFITGSGQNQAAGDFTVNGVTITTSQGCNLGDTIYGIIQI